MDFQSIVVYLFSFNSSAQNIQFTEEEKAWMKKHPVIEFGYEPRWLPFEIYENGEYSGIIGEYVKILERETGIDFNPIPDINWDETVAGLKSGEIDFTCCAGITEDRKEYLNFTKPYISSPMVIVTRKDGDFYWLVTKGGKSWFAVVDCTGHGVPGAFMSIVGYNLLNKIVGEYGVTEPSKILDELNKGVAKMLKKDDDSAEYLRDGMDIALCCFDKKNKILEYAGAYNPLYIVSKHGLNSSKKGDLKPVYMSKKGLNLYEVKANRFPIGDYTEETLEFTNHRIQLNSGDTIYLFSDGYVDQFGGEKGKKYRYRRFKEFLVSMNDLSMEDQKSKLEAEFIDWMGPHEQIDDVLVIGSKL